MSSAPENSNPVVAATPPAAALDQFEALLAARTKVPANRLEELLGLPDEALRREVDEVSQILQRFARAVVRSMEERGSATTFLQDLDLQLISRDHDWRAIFSTLRAQRSAPDEHKHALLIRYLQYLTFRKRLLEFVYTRRANLEETRVFPSGAFDVGDGAADGMFRLPLGELLRVRPKPGQPIPLRIGKHEFSLQAGQPPQLVDPQGNRLPLPQGRTVVGRHPGADLVVDGQYTSISRTHLILEWLPEENTVTLTDLSSSGTWVPLAALEAPGMRSAPN